MHQKKILEKLLSEKIIKINDTSKGIDQKVKIIETTTKKYIVKIPKEKIMNYRENFACTKLKNKIPIPKIVYYSENILIENYIDGTEFNKTKLTSEEKTLIYFKLGQYLKKINKIKTEGFGFITKKGKGEFKTLRQSVYPKLQSNLHKIKKGNILSNKDLEKINIFFQQNDFYLNSTESFLLHFDYEDYNIKIKNNRITGILDFGDLSSGPKAFDLARMYIKLYKSKMLESFLKGYGKINQKEIIFFSVVTTINFIAYFIKKRDIQKIKKYLKILKTFIK